MSGGVPFGMSSLEIVADEIIYFSLARVGSTERNDVLPRGLVVRRVFTSLGSGWRHSSLIAAPCSSPSCDLIQADSVRTRHSRNHRGKRRREMAKNVRFTVPSEVRNLLHFSGVLLIATISATKSNPLCRLPFRFREGAAWSIAAIAGCTRANRRTQTDAHTLPCEVSQAFRSAALRPVVNHCWRC
jgi:hypothetical protein